MIRPLLGVALVFLVVLLVLHRLTTLRARRKTQRAWRAAYLREAGRVWFRFGSWRRGPQRIVDQRADRGEPPIGLAVAVPDTRRAGRRD